MSTREVVLCHPVRTAIGTYNGSLKDIAAPALGAAVIRETMKRAQLAADKIEALVMGNVIQAGVRMNPARQAGIAGGLPVSVPALTVNRVCGSAAQAAGKFAAEIVPFEVPGRKGPTILDKDEHNRPETTAESLAKLKPAFRKDGTITAGNAPGLNTAAAAMIVAERDWAEKNGLVPMARLVSYGIGAVEPGFFGLGPVPAVRQALTRAGWKIGDVDRVEINEAFAAIALACLRELGFAEDVVNVEGGAIAHGHPIGASGAVLATRLMHSMKRDGLKRGIVTLCIGGGQGIALALELPR